MKTIISILFVALMLSGCDKQKEQVIPRLNYIDIKVEPYQSGDYAFRIYLSNSSTEVDTATSKVYRFKVGNVRGMIENPIRVYIAEECSYYVVGYRLPDGSPATHDFVFIPTGKDSFIKIPSTIY